MLSQVYVLIILLRNRLINALNAPSFPSSSTSDSDPPPAPNSPVTTSPPNVEALRYADYPQVKHWVQKRGDSAQISVIKVVDENDLSDNNGNARNDDSNQEDGVLAFLE